MGYGPLDDEERLSIWICLLCYLWKTSAGENTMIRYSFALVGIAVSLFLSLALALYGMAVVFSLLF